MVNLGVQLFLPRDTRYVSVMRRVAQCLLTGLALPKEDVEDIELVLSEACTNVVRHAEGTDRYSVNLQIDARECAIEIVDWGPGFGADFQTSAAGTALSGEADETGRGLHLMRTLVDDLQFSRDERETTVRLVKRWRAPAGPKEPDGIPHRAGARAL